MNRINSRAKGNQFELQIAKELSYTLFPYLKEKNLDATSLPFRRTPMSGGWSTTISEDIIFNGSNPYLSEEDKNFNWWYAVECKWHATYNLESLITSREKSIITQWWNQTINEAYLTHKEPLLIFKKNGHEPLFMMKYKQNYSRLLDGTCAIFNFEGYSVIVDTFERLKVELIKCRRLFIDFKE